MLCLFCLPLRTGAGLGPRRGAPVLAAALLALGLAAPAAAASFDCAKARTPVEKAICSDAELSAQDERLAQAYREALARSPQPEAVRLWQRHWLAGARAECEADVACLRRTLAAQASELQAHGAAVAAQPGAGSLTAVLQLPGRGGSGARLTLVQLGPARLRVFGQATWAGDAAAGQVNTGEVAGYAEPTGVAHTWRVVDAANDACRFDLVLGPGEAVTVRGDSGACGGLNVSFNGTYRRQAAAAVR